MGDTPLPSRHRCHSELELCAWAYEAWCEVGLALIGRAGLGLGREGDDDFDGHPEPRRSLELSAVLGLPASRVRLSLERWRGEESLSCAFGVEGSQDEVARLSTLLAVVLLELPRLLQVPITLLLMRRLQRVVQAPSTANFQRLRQAVTEPVVEAIRIRLEARGASRQCGREELARLRKMLSRQLAVVVVGDALRDLPDCVVEGFGATVLEQLVSLPRSQFSAAVAALRESASRGTPPGRLRRQLRGMVRASRTGRGAARETRPSTSDPVPHSFHIEAPR